MCRASGAQQSACTWREELSERIRGRIVLSRTAAWDWPGLRGSFVLRASDDASDNAEYSARCGSAWVLGIVLAALSTVGAVCAVAHSLIYSLLSGTTSSGHAGKGAALRTLTANMNGSPLLAHRLSVGTARCLTRARSAVRTPSLMESGAASRSPPVSVVNSDGRLETISWQSSCANAYAHARGVMASKSARAGSAQSLTGATCAGRSQRPALDGASCPPAALHSCAGSGWAPSCHCLPPTVCR